MSAHYRTLEDKQGDLIDLIPFCGDACHRDYCLEHGLEYQGWNGCHETSYDQICAKCRYIIAADIEGEGQ